MKHGLSKEDVEKIKEVLKKFPEIEEAVIFGSRALKTQKKGSDIDLALKGKLDHSLVAKIKGKLEEDIPLPYFFDVVDYPSINNTDLRNHIDQHGDIFYRKTGS